MFVKSFFILLTFSFFLGASEKIIVENRCTGNLEKLTDRQITVLLKSFTVGAKYDLGYTLAAIAWQESCAGEYRVNFQDPSAGIYHAYIPGVLDRYPSLKNSGLMQNMIGDRLINDDDFAAKEAISELEYWKKVHKDSWKNIIKSYNRGFSWQKNSKANDQAEKYYSDIQEKVRQLKEYIYDLRMDKARGRMLAMPIYQQKQYAKTEFKLLVE